jgi:DNA-binding NarL/FixJ family response regulator
MSGGNLRVLIVDDHAVFGQSLGAALAAYGFTVVAVESEGRRAVSRCVADPPDVVVMDYRLPDLGGADLLSALHAAAPAVAVVVLTASVDERTLQEAMDAGCSAFLTKDQSLEEVARSIRAAAGGEAVLPAALLGKMLERIRRGQNPGRSENLTAREIEVLELMAGGAANQAIANDLFLSLNTVRNHVRNVLSKLGAHSKLEAVAIATRRGIISPPQD